MSKGFLLPTTGHSKIIVVEYEPDVTVLGAAPEPIAFTGLEINKIEPTIAAIDVNRIIAFI